MNAPPPPPPPAPPQAPTPSGYVASARHLRREQRRAAAYAAKQQKALKRLQRRLLRRSSTLGPVLLIALGTTFLVSESLSVSPQRIFLWVVQNWPLLLVAAGTVLLAEWALDRRNAVKLGTPVPRRTLGFFSTVLLIALILFGVASSHLDQSGRLLSQLWTTEAQNGVGLAQLFAQHSDTTRQMSAPLKAGGLFTISNHQGNISVNGSSEDGQVHVTARQRTSAWQSSDLHRREARNEPVLISGSDGLTLNIAGEGQDETDLVIEVPHTSEVRINSEKGDVTLTQLRGPVTIADHRGGVTLTALTGPVDLTIHDDEAAVNVHSLTGDLFLTGRAGDLAFSDVDGQVRLDGDFFGTTHMERINGALSFRSSFTQIRCASVPGTLDVEGRSELSAANVNGPLIINTTDRNLQLDDVHQGASILNKNGAVNLSLSPPLAPTSVSTSSGALDVHVPSAASFRLHARTLDGEIETDLLSGVSHSGSESVLEGNVGKAAPAAPYIDLSNRQGDINLAAVSSTQHE